MRRSPPGSSPRHLPSPTTLHPMSVLLLSLAWAGPELSTPEAARTLGDHWFVLLSSKIEPGDVPAGLATMAAQPGLAGHPARLSSTWFKNLMPCYEIVVADAFPATKEGRAQARAYSAKLKAAGVDHYLKEAGPWVGERPELDDYCAAVREPPRPPEGWWFADEAGIALTVDPAVEAELPDPPLRPEGSSYDLWRAPLPIRNLGSWQVDQALVGVTPTGVADCRVTGFARGVVGTPHFGALQGGTPTAPSCGEEQLYATLDCPAIVALPAGAAVQAFTASTDTPTWMAGFRAQASSALDGDRAEANVQAEAAGTRVTEAWTATRWRGGAAEVWLVEATVESGDGAWFCGGEDFASRRVWWARADGTVIAGPEPVLGERILTAADLDGDGLPELLLADEITGSHRVWSKTASAHNPHAYCDCPC